MFASLRSRLLLTHLLVAGLVLLLLVISFALILASNPVGEGFVYSRLDTINRIGAVQLRQRSVERNRLALERLLSLLERPIQAHVVLLGPDGRVAVEGPADAPSVPAEAIEAALADEAGRSSFRDGQRRRWLLVASALPDGRTLLALAPRPTVRTLALLAREGLVPLGEAALVALILSALVALAIAGWVSGPLVRLATAARQVAAGEYDLGLEPTGPVEARELVIAFNDMVRQVRASQRAQQDFVANVSHELKTPLTSIQGFAQALIDGTAGSRAEQVRAGQVIYQESDRLRRLVEDLLDLARFDADQAALERLPVDLTALLDDVLERMRVAATEKRIELRREIAELPTMIGDPDRLAQVFINLLDNAIQHTPVNGQVSLSAGREGGWLKVQVIDRGPGIEPEALPRLFERFYQVDRSRSGRGKRGTGLGLAIAQEIVRAHGGTIGADSALGVGSVFEVRLPVVRPDDSTIQRNRR